MNHREMCIYKGIFFFLLFGLISCGNVLDNVSKSMALPIEKGYIYYYGDKNVLVYKPTVGLRRDSEEYMPKSFKIDLPEGMKFYEIVEPDDFVIYYSKKQVFYIHIDPDSDGRVDTVYTPDEDELDDFIQEKLSFHDYKYDIKKIKLNKSRKTVMLKLKKGQANILLYNISSVRLEVFLKAVRSFRFL